MDGQVKVIEACDKGKGREAEMRKDRKDKCQMEESHTWEEWAREQYIVDSPAVHADITPFQPSHVILHKSVIS